MIARTLTTWQDGDAYVGVTLSGETVCIGHTRNEDDAAEGYYGRTQTVMSLEQAIAMAKAVLAAANLEAEIDYFDFLADRERERQDALADALSAHFAHD